MIVVTLNENQVTGTSGTTILELARAHDIEIPTLCYHPDLSPAGVCRLCLVEVQGSRTLVASCHTPIAPNMVIATHSARVIKARQMAVQLLLASHSGFCWACDKANLCELKHVAAALGVGPPPFSLPKPYFALENAGPFLIRDLTKCILCRRCVRACRELKGAGLLAIAHRGFAAKVVFDQDRPLDAAVCVECDSCVALCPVGALTRIETALH